MKSNRKTIAGIIGLTILIVMMLAVLVGPAAAQELNGKPSKTPKPPSGQGENQGNNPVKTPKPPDSNTSSTTSGNNSKPDKGTPTPGDPSSSGVVPVLILGNNTCGSLGYGTQELKIDPPNSGTYTIDSTNTITVSADGLYFNWSSTTGIVAVFVKGGPDGNLYIYNPASTGDGSLHSPVNPNNGKVYGLSHISFCYNPPTQQYALTVAKTAVTSFTRYYNWSITKAAAPDSWSLTTGQSGTSTYTVTVMRTPAYDSDWAVSGTITITNPSPSDVALSGIVDDVEGVHATVSCPTMTVPANGTLTCTYWAALPDGSNRVNTVTVMTPGPVTGGTATADVVFGNPTTEINGTVNVQDTNGQAWTFSDSGSVSYDRAFTCPTDQGSHDNEATIVETNQTASATVNVVCTAPVVRKDAATAFTRTYQWDIQKTVSADTVNLFSGTSGTATYTITVNRTGFTDSDWSVSGHVWITNPGPDTAQLSDVVDVISPDITVGLDCGVSLPYMMAPGETLTCIYGTSLPDGTQRVNTATVTLDGNTYSATADVIFSTPTAETNASIDVQDSNGPSWTFGDSGSVSYDRTFSCDVDQGQHSNEATIVQTGQSSEATLTVNCYGLLVTKDAATSQAQVWQWTIAKTGDQSALTLAVGQQSPVNYQVVLNATSQSSVWRVTGNIYVTNPAPIPAQINTVSDVVSGGFPAVVNCGVAFPYSLAGGDSLTCSYSGTLPDNSPRTNTATVTLEYAPGVTADFYGEAPVDFSNAASSEVDKCVSVSDDKYGVLGTLCAPDAPHTFAYTLPVGPYATCGTYNFTNTASFVTNDTGATNSSSWTVNVTVPCTGGQGCTLTQGYWKTHSKYGPAKLDNTWALIGEDTTFFLSGQTWFQVISTPSSDGNAYYILARQYIAARLNVLAGADPSTVAAQIAHAEELFNTYTPTSTLSDAVRQDFINTAGILDQYNNGLIGPGHCNG